MVITIYDMPPVMEEAVGVEVYVEDHDEAIKLMSLLIKNGAYVLGKAN